MTDKAGFEEVFQAAKACADSLTFKYPSIRFQPYVVEEDDGSMWAQIGISADDAEKLL